jgi:hypothetical protein
MSNRTLGLLVATLAVLVGLAATNPTMSDYVQHLEMRLDEVSTAIAPREQGGQARPGRDGRQGRDDRMDLLRELLRQNRRPLIESLILPNTVRRNYGVASLFETTVFNTKVFVLGIAGFLVPLKGTDELVLAIRRQVLPEK